mgnify:CR=1 FL=1
MPLKWFEPILFKQIIFNLTTPIFVATLIAMTVYYPISDWIGSYFCYFYIYGFLWVTIYGQSLSFFITVFRYICLYHEDKLSFWQITPKVNSLWSFFDISYDYKSFRVTFHNVLELWDLSRYCKQKILINNNFFHLKTLGKTLVALQVIITTFLTVSYLVPNPTHRGLDQCLGNFMPHFFLR